TCSSSTLTRCWRPLRTSRCQPSPPIPTICVSPTTAVSIRANSLCATRSPGATKAWCTSTSPARRRARRSSFPARKRCPSARARRPGTYLRDAQLLEEALREDPENPRNVFYLAQCYRDGGELELAIRNYQRRAQMRTGWADEAWFALYQVAQLKQRLDHPWPEVLAAYWTAWEADQTRAGPLYRMAAYYQAARQHHLSHFLLSKAVEIPAPSPGRPFVDATSY